MMTAKLALLATMFVAFVNGQANYCDPTLCSVGKTHVACKYQLLSWNDAVCLEANKALSVVTATDKQLIVDLHNQVRRKVAKGLETRGTQGPQPSASNMRQMVWNDELASLAQTLAQQCVFEHDQCRNIPSKSAGQNIYIAMSSIPYTLNSWSEAITAVQDSWYSEVDLMTNSQIASFKKEAPIGVIGHYTQLVWATTYEVGCGVSHYKTPDGWYNQLIVCNYGPTGNYLYQPVYQVGTPASACPAGTTPNDGLCA